MAVLRSNVQRRGASLRANAYNGAQQLSAILERHTARLRPTRIATSAANDHAGSAHLVLAVHDRAALQQQPHQLHVALLSGAQQRREASLRSRTRQRALAPRALRRARAGRGAVVSCAAQGPLAPRWCTPGQRRRAAQRALPPRRRAALLRGAAPHVPLCSSPSQKGTYAARVLVTRKRLVAQTQRRVRVAYASVCAPGQARALRPGAVARRAGQHPWRAARLPARPGRAAARSTAARRHAPYQGAEAPAHAAAAALAAPAPRAHTPVAPPRQAREDGARFSRGRHGRSSPSRLPRQQRHRSSVITHGARHTRRCSANRNTWRL